MKVQNYKCDVCKESLAKVEEFIGFSRKVNANEYYPVPVEKAENHICRQCLDNLAKFQKRWAVKSSMTPVQLKAWELSW